ncbi:MULTISPECIES: TetR/AcrR family transcriptional regulator [unclassified Burkholderia]|uniref:TetR/AcrR family transcriptional regulator n=1 Tax=unclassified Burkholderia TaxID=2613784 RepID=UPI002AB15959|nr:MULTISPECIES: TetR/AcrR family transcriptional regulator [unclassified Burkholderia]
MRELKQQLEKFDWSEQTPGRRNILDAFLKLAASMGYSAVSMRVLSTEVNLKAPSIYSHFPGGRDEIVAEALRWHYYRFGMDVIEATGGCRGAEEFWDALVRLHVICQLERPECDMWDLVVATDRIGEFLQPEIRKEVRQWLAICEGLYEAAALDMGYVEAKVKSRIVMTLLNGAGSWCAWNGDKACLDACAHMAIVVTRSILSSEKIAPDTAPDRRKAANSSRARVDSTQ